MSLPNPTYLSPTPGGSGPKKSNSFSPLKPTSLRSEIIQNLIQKSFEENRTALDLSRKFVSLEIPRQITILAPILTHLNLSYNEVLFDISDVSFLFCQIQLVSFRT
jgi:hypothetical protein